MVGTLSVNSSSHDILILSAVAGAISWNIGDRPRSFLAATIASFIAKKTDDARATAGSPMPLDECTAWGFSESSEKY